MCFVLLDPQMKGAVGNLVLGKHGRQVSGDKTDPDGLIQSKAASYRKRPWVQFLASPAEKFLGSR